MKLFNFIPKNFLFFIAPVSLVLLSSCSSYQYSGYETDGIYGDANRGYDRQVQHTTQNNEAGSYYQRLFAEEAALYGDVLAENTIFTDVESYSSAGNYEEGSEAAYTGGRAPWGNDPDSYAINIINTGMYSPWFDPYWGGMGMYGFDMWGPGFGMWGPGYGMWGPRHGMWGPRFGGMWGSRWAMGFGGFGYGGFGYGFMGHPYMHGGGWGWNNPYFNRGFTRSNVAYNQGRRSSATSYRGESSTIRSAANMNNRTRSSSYSRSIRNLRGSNDNYGPARRSVARDYNTARSNTNYNMSRSRTIDSRTSRSSDTYSRQSMPATRSSNTVRSSSPVRSSGTVRSSGGAVRSSGGGGRSSSGGGSRGGRGN